MGELVKVLREMGWSWVLWLVVVLFVVKTVLDMAAEASPIIAKTLGWYGRRVLARQEKRQGQVETIAELRTKVAELQHFIERSSSAAADDLRAEVDQLAYQLRLVRWRAEMTDAYLIEDADFHRDVALAGITVPAHTAFPDFERTWKTEHPRPQPRRTDPKVN